MPAPLNEAVARSMRSNRRTGTRPEMRIRSELHGRGLRFRKDLVIETPEGRVRPDIVFTRARVAVFVDGCFWHSCPEHASRPRSNAQFWADKLRRTRERDSRDEQLLLKHGWNVVRVWEHTPPAEAADAVARAVSDAGTAELG